MDATYSKWFAIGFREKLQSWDGPEPLEKADSVCCIGSITDDGQHEIVREKIRHLIGSKQWSQLSGIAPEANDDDFISWYLIIGPNEMRYVVEVSSPYEFTAHGNTLAVWKVSQSDAEAIKTINSNLYLLRRPKCRTEKQILALVKKVAGALFRIGKRGRESS